MHNLSQRDAMGEKYESVTIVVDRSLLGSNVSTQLEFLVPSDGEVPVLKSDVGGCSSLKTLLKYRAQ